MDDLAVFKGTKTALPNVLAAGIVLLLLLLVLWRLLPPAVSANSLLLRNISTGRCVRRVFFYKKNPKAAKRKLCNETKNFGGADDNFLLWTAKKSPYNIYDRPGQILHFLSFYLFSVDNTVTFVETLAFQRWVYGTTTPDRCGVITNRV